MAVQLAAFGLEAPHQAIELARQPQVRPDWGSLHGAGARNEDLEVVHSSEQVLRLLERTNRSHRSRAAQVANQLHRIPQLLDGYANLVQAIGQVNAGGVVDGRAQRRRPP